MHWRFYYQTYFQKLIITNQLLPIVDPTLFKNRIFFLQNRFINASLINIEIVSFQK